MRPTECTGICLGTGAVTNKNLVPQYILDTLGIMTIGPHIQEQQYIGETVGFICVHIHLIFINISSIEYSTMVAAIVGS